jgi:GNAT superfamily N-acetyltransferase
MTNIERANPADLASRALLGAYFDELRVRWGVVVDLETVLASRDMLPPRGAFFVVREERELVACGGVRVLGRGVREVKRMFVVPEARRRGHARRLLAALEEHARVEGAKVMRLDTDARDVEAVKLYESSGYQAVPAYNDNPDASAWFEKRL